MQRSAGILLPISSLPSPYGIGCFSQEAYDFVDWLKEAGQTYWQILPLGVTSYGDSPYQSFSAFAGNPYFISLDALVEEGVLTAAECKKANFGRKADDIDYSRLYNRPSQWTELLLQLLFYLFMSFVLLTILTDSHRRYSMRRYIRSCLWSCVAAVVLYCVAPVTEWHSGRVVLNFMGGRMFDYMLLLKCSFALVVSLLYSRLYVLISQRQLVEVENERLKNENLTTRYNMLVGQINPHFFFNSLNSLAMLVREKHDQKALTYIDQLSYTFRYIIQNGQSTLITLGEELKFAEAYSYLFKIRYADKLYFDIEVDPDYLCWRLPALSLQPLIGNAVKHNTITRSNPLHVSIRVEDGRLVVSNPLRPKLEPEPSTGIGLENLRNRWQLITGHDIEIDDSDGTFTVRLPLEPPVAR